jgi:hypothetical protein
MPLGKPNLFAKKEILFRGLNDVGGNYFMKEEQILLYPPIVHQIKETNVGTKSNGSD